MKKDYIAIGGKEYRVEVNWNALTAFLQAVGRDTIEDLDLGAIIGPADVAAFMDIYVRQSAPRMEVEEPKKEAREESPAR